MKYLKSTALLEYIDSVCHPLLDYLDTGISLRISRNGDVIKNFVPFLLAFSVDSAEGFQICGTKAGHRKCRMCEAFTYDFNPKQIPAKRRNDDASLSYQELGYRCLLVAY